ncbi:MAG: hypothetical protein K5695_14545 [Oscillospiraceae bacterium]|nr:hypothetical protein [Oscillospiraceae bacterium]
MKKLIALALLGAMLISATACGKSAEAAEDNCIYGQIESISGNDIVIRVAEYNEEEAQDDAQAEDAPAEGKDSGKRPDFKGEKPEGFSRPDKGERPERPENGEMPEGFDPENLPEGFDPSKFKDGEKPEGFSRPDNGEMPESFDPENLPEGFDPSKFGGKRPGGSSKYNITDEEKEVRIPVGTSVTTAQGVETDFSVLAAGDIIKCSIAVDKDGNETVTAVWIMEE